MYTRSILWMLSWPALLFISYLVIKIVVRKYEVRHNTGEEVPEQPVLKSGSEPAVGAGKD